MTNTSATAIEKRHNEGRRVQERASAGAVWAAAREAMLAAASSLDRTEALSRIAAAALQALGGSAAGILVLAEDGRRLEAQAAAAAPGIEAPPLPSLSARSRAWAAIRGQGLLSGDVEDDPRLGGYRRPLRTCRAKSLAAAPLTVQGQALGLLAVSHCGRKNAFRARDLDLLRLFAAQAALALDNRRLREDNDYARERLGAQMHAWQQVLRDIADPVMLLDDQRRVRYGNPALFAALGREPQEVLGRPWRELVDAKAAEIIERAYRAAGGKAPFTCEINAPPGFGDTPARLRCVPVRGREGRLLGMIAVLVEVGQHLRMEGTLRDRGRMLDAVARLARTAARSPDIEQLGRRALRYALTATGLSSGTVHLIEGDEFVLTAARGMPRELLALIGRLPTGGPVATRAFGRGPVVIADQRRAEQISEEFRRVVPAHCKSLAVVPILGRDRPVGLLCLAAPQRSVFSTEALRVLKILAAELGAAVENVRLLQAERWRAERLAMLNAASERLLRATHEVEEWPVLADTMLRLLRARRLLFMEFRVLHDHFKRAHGTGFAESRLRRAQRMFPLRMKQMPLVAQAVQERRPVRCPDVAAQQALPAEMIEALGLRDAVAVPLISPRELWGVLVIDNAGKPLALSEDDHDLVMALANQAALAADNLYLWRESRGHSERMALAMQEAHHRIKNNLQAVCDVLELELMDGGRHGSARAIEDCVQRVRAIAMVHELLTTHDEVRLVEVSELITRLAPLTVASSQRSDQEVQVTVRACPLRQSSKRATALALIVNELVTNAVQHGLQASRRCAVRVELRESGGMATLQVSDNGDGLPEGFEPHAGAHVGLAIARVLAERDLGGQITLQRRRGRAHGTTAAVRFPK